MSQARRPQNDALGALASLCRLGRSLGIHFVGATQRPDAGVLPGQIKANIPATVAFKVREPLNSRILLGEENSSAATLPPVPEFVNPSETFGGSNQLAGITSSAGRLIHAGPGSSGGSGALRTKRSGWAV